MEKDTNEADHSGTNNLNEQEQPVVMLPCLVLDVLGCSERTKILQVELTRVIFLWLFSVYFLFWGFVPDMTEFTLPPW